MQMKNIDRLELPPTADMHVHLRQAELMELVVPTVRKGGVDTVFVMPNLVPPLTSVEKVLEYRSQLHAITQDVHFLMSLFLHPSVTPEVIAQAAAAGITGVKMYPQGVTTNSESGVSNLEAFYTTFAAMEKHGLVLNLHGEVLESLAPADTTLEEAFLPTLKTLHERFPQLRIVLEHCTTAAAVEAVRACGPTVGATITAHHLYLTSHEACCDPFAFCKPIPKKPTDRDALVRAVVSGDTKFFFGSDSAPHPIQTKTSAAQGKAPAGVFTQPFATQLVLLALEEAIERGAIVEADVTQEKLEGFLSRSGRRFYKLPEVSEKGKIVLERKGEKIPASVLSQDGKAEVGNSRVGAEVFSLRWEGA
ncbi:amidohydrolase 2 [Phialemonium atrogriseum]|uniref:dihydroorotase n=1 Tax=Phialemonium atrogriseum TaxID=1093897 RepID=A0AAJ0BS31_9PEZI|nr:amidohydrolase 2 [Phialemonium atrogriseum]KAK1761992.1 amidohydrolase 2 [Phialemonium atrogriseum]